MLLTKVRTGTLRPVTDALPNYWGFSEVVMARHKAELLMVRMLRKRSR